MKRVSIKDIAQIVGVSNATVSLVLNGKAKEGRVSKKMMERIQLEAKAMNYQPNRLARSLQSGYSQTIGLILADISNPFFGALALYVQERLAESSYAVIMMNTNEENLQMKKNIELLESRQVDGFIISPTENGEEYIAELVQKNIPLVLIDRYFPSVETCNVLVDNEQASYDATRYLIEKGCKRIGIVIYGNNQAHMLNRKNGFRKALEEIGSYDDDLVKGVKYNTLAEDVRKAVSELMNEEPSVDGILFATNSIALMGIKQLLSLQISIPDQVQVACFDKNDAFDLISYAVPYVQQPIDLMAFEAVDLLLKQIRNESKEIVTRQFPATLKERNNVF